MKVFGEYYSDMHIIDRQRDNADDTPIVSEAAKRPSAKEVEILQ